MLQVNYNIIKYITSTFGKRLPTLTGKQKNKLLDRD